MLSGHQGPIRGSSYQDGRLGRRGHDPRGIPGRHQATQELREHEKQAIQELGQWSEKASVEQGPMQVRIVGVTLMLTVEAKRQRQDSLQRNT
jgi:hypothetical protein